jgi:hypothetical protein
VQSAGRPAAKVPARRHSHQMKSAMPAMSEIWERRENANADSFMIDPKNFS